MTKLKFPLFLLLAAMVTGRTQHHRALRQRRSEITEKEKRLPHDQCGQQKANLGPIPLEERYIQPGEFPWLATLGYQIQGSNSTLITWACEGSLIADQYVITAAQCLDEKLLSLQISGARIQWRPTYVRLGVLSLDSKDNNEVAAGDYAIENIVIHKDWSNVHKVNDLGLIRLKEKVNFSDSVSPICLPPTTHQSPMFSEGNFPMIASRGFSEKYINESSRLLKVRVKVANQESCRANITAKNTGTKVDESVLCAETKGNHACVVETGFPLMYYFEPDDGSPERQYLIGVVSYGVGCGQEGNTGVYSRVSYHMPWILEHLDI